MKQGPVPGPARTRQRGQSLMEYVIVCAALAIALFVPLPGSDDGAGARSALEILLDGFQKAYQRFTHSISLPS